MKSLHGISRSRACFSFLLKPSWSESEEDANGRRGDLGLIKAEIQRREEAKKQRYTSLKKKDEDAKEDFPHDISKGRP